MSNSPDSRDRRKHLRLPADREFVKFRRVNPLPSGEPDVYHEGSLVNLSKGGMYFQTTHAIMRGEKIEYFLQSASGTGDREGVARISRVNRDPDRFFVAVEFIS
jgi:hypothetical protein